VTPTSIPPTPQPTATPINYAGSYAFTGTLTGGNPSNTSTTYGTIITGGSWTTTSTNGQATAQVAGTAEYLTVTIGAAPGLGKSYTFTLEKNAADTAITCQITGTTATSCTDLAHTATFAATDKINMKCVPASSPASITGVLTTTWTFATGASGLPLQ
jgi:hypothetical protein